MSPDQWTPAPPPGEELEPPQADPDPEFQSPIKKEKGILQRIGGGIVAAVLALFKFGGFLLLGASKAKFVLSFLIFIAGYAWFWGWKFGVGFAILLLVHEMGHVIQLRREGVPASVPIFIPFMGAFVGMKELPKNAWVEAKVGLAGPVLGTVGALVTLGLGAYLDSDLLRALAYTAFFLNLFNLIPVVPLDGGRALNALHPAMWFVGLFIVALLAFHYESPIIFLILAFVVFEVWVRWGHRNDPETRAYNAIPRSQRVAVFAVYMALVVILVVGMDIAHVPNIGFN
jgi:Zn-dependent protease